MHDRHVVGGLVEAVLHGRVGLDGGLRNVELGVHDSFEVVPDLDVVGYVLVEERQLVERSFHLRVEVLEMEVAPGFPVPYRLEYDGASGLRPRLASRRVSAPIDQRQHRTTAVLRVVEGLYVGESGFRVLDRLPQQLEHARRVRIEVLPLDLNRRHEVLVVRGVIRRSYRSSNRAVFSVHP